jgi:hypothetical protein
MFVMNFMRPSQGFSIHRSRSSKQSKSLVNKDVMHQKISQTICKNPQTYSQSKLKNFQIPQQHKSHTNNGIKDKKHIISFKP